MTSKDYMDRYGAREQDRQVTMQTVSGARSTHLPPLIAFFPEPRSGGVRRRCGAWKEGDPSFRGSFQKAKRGNITGEWKIAILDFEFGGGLLMSADCAAPLVCFLTGVL